MVEVSGVTEIILYVEEMEPMVEFYTDAFGFEVVEGTAESGFVRFGTGGCDLCLHAGRDGDLGSAAPTVVFGVDDIAAARSRLEAYDITLGESREPVPGTTVVDGLDPEGNRFSIEAQSTPT